MDVARIWLPRVLAIAAFCLYALVAPPGFYWLDPAELAASAIRLGSPHPTGFPLHAVLGWLAALVPLGELGFRIALLSAGCAALAVLWTAKLGFLLIGRNDAHALVGSAAGAIVLAVSLVFLRQATVAGVYAPSLALLCGTLILFERVARGGDARWGLALTLVCGLGLTMAMPYALLGPPVILLVAIRLRRGARWPLLAPLLLVAGLAGLLVYLPARSTTAGASAVVPGHANGSYHPIGNPIASVVMDDMGPFVLLAVLAGGLWLIWRRPSRWLTGTIFWLAGASAGYPAWIDPVADRAAAVVFCLAGCLVAGAGIAWFARVLGRAGPFAGGAAGAIAAISAGWFSLAEVWPARESDSPRTWAEAALTGLPPQSIALVHSKATAAGLFYLTAVEAARPDVTVLVRQDLGEPTYAALLATGRTIGWEIGDDAIPANTRLVAGRPLGRLEPITPPITPLPARPAGRDQPPGPAPWP